MSKHILFCLFICLIGITESFGQSLIFDSLSVYKLGGKRHLINNKGIVMTNDEFDFIIINCRDSLITVAREEAAGYMNKHGKIRMPLKYKFVNRFYNGLAQVYDENMSVGYINPYGEILIPLEDPFSFDGLKGIYNDERIVKSKELFYGYIDGHNNLVIPFKYDDARMFQDQRAIVGQKDNWSITLYGTIDKNNNVQIPLEYNYLEYQYNDLYYAGKFFNFGQPDYHYAMGCVNSRNEVVVPFKYDSIQLRQKHFYIKGNECYELKLENYIACNIRDEGWRIVDTRNGKETACCYNDVGEVKGGYLEVKKDKWGLVDSLGNVKILLIYDFIENYGDDIVAVKKNNKWAYFKTDGSQITDFVYDYVTAFRLGYALIKQNGKYHLIDKTGKVKLANFPVNEKEGAYIHHPVQGTNTLLFWKKGKYGLMNMDGKIIFPARSEEAILFVR